MLKRNSIFIQLQHTKWWRFSKHAFSTPCANVICQLKFRRFWHRWTYAFTRVNATLPICNHAVSDLFPLAAKWFLLFHILWIQIWFRWFIIIFSLVKLFHCLDSKLMFEVYTNKIKWSIFEGLNTANKIFSFFKSVRLEIL